MTRMTRGFTLIEVLVAVGLLAFAMALGLAALRSLAQSSARTEGVAQRNERLRGVQGFLRAELSAALPMAFAPDPSVSELRQMDGHADKLQFVAVMPGYLSRGGAYLQTFEIVSGTGGKRLQYQFQQLGPDGPLPAERPAKVLLDGIADARFEFRTIDQDSQPGPWLAQWSEPGSLPPLVRLRLRFADPRLRWPELVVAVRMGTASAPATPGEPAPIDAGGAP